MTAQQSILDALMSALDEDHAIAVMEHRKVTVKKPLTTFAAKLLAKRLSEWGDANAAAEIMIEKCWQGFSVEWVKDRRRPVMTGNALIDALTRHH